MCPLKPYPEVFPVYPLDQLNNLQILEENTEVDSDYEEMNNYDDASYDIIFSNNIAPALNTTFGED